MLLRQQPFTVRSWDISFRGVRCFSMEIMTS